MGYLVKVLYSNGMEEWRERLKIGVTGVGKGIFSSNLQSSMAVHRPGEDCSSRN
jgi:hypothetical protein